MRERSVALASTSAEERATARGYVDSVVARGTAVERRVLARSLSEVPGPLAARFLALLAADDDVQVRLIARVALLERDRSR